MAVSESQRQAWKRYSAKVRTYILRINAEREPDIVDRLDSVSNRQGYIKELVRNDIAQERLAGMRP